MRKVRIKNPSRNSEKTAIQKHGDIWELRPHGFTHSFSPINGMVLIGINDDLRWWKAENVEPVD